MHCFNHSTDAVGICKHCQRALCVDCCTDLGDGLACKGVHEAEVSHLNALIQNSKKSYSSSPRAALFAPLFNLFFGLAFLIFGVVQSETFPIVLGIGFLVFALASFAYNARFFRKLTTDYDA